jgi:hypothetical protein
MLWGKRGLAHKLPNRRQSGAGRTSRRDSMVWIIELLACIIAALSFSSDYTAATSAPQQCVAISMALLIVILPYCFCRAISGIGQSSSVQSSLISEIRKLNEQVATHTKLLASIANGTPEKEALTPRSTDASGE